MLEEEEGWGGGVEGGGIYKRSDVKLTMVNKNNFVRTLSIQSGKLLTGKLVRRGFVGYHHVLYVS